MAKIGDFYNLALGSVEVSSTMNRLYNKVFNDELDIRNVIKLKKLVNIQVEELKEILAIKPDSDITEILNQEIEHDIVCFKDLSGLSARDIENLEFLNK